MKNNSCTWSEWSVEMFQQEHPICCGRLRFKGLGLFQHRETFAGVAARILFMSTSWTPIDPYNGSKQLKCLHVFCWCNLIAFCWDFGPDLLIYHNLLNLLALGSFVSNPKFCAWIEIDLHCLVSQSLQDFHHMWHLVTTTFLYDPNGIVVVVAVVVRLDPSYGCRNPALSTQQM